MLTGVKDHGRQGIKDEPWEDGEHAPLPGLTIFRSSSYGTSTMRWPGQETGWVNQPKQKHKYGILSGCVSVSLP